MKVLGLNVGHDSGVTIVDEHSVLAAVSEERLSRKKMHTGFPYLALDEALALAGCSPRDIDLVAVEGDKVMPHSDFGTELLEQDWRKILVEKSGLARPLLGTRAGLGMTYRLLSRTTAHTKKKVADFLRNKGFAGPVNFFDHHTCHAASAYFGQRHPVDGFAVTLDASGEGLCSKVFRCREGKMVSLHDELSFHSPAYYYAYITHLAGFKAFRHEGKITGLAAYDSGEKVKMILERFINFDAKKGCFKNKGGYQRSAVQRLKDLLAPFTKEQIAAGVQVHTEAMVTDYVAWIVRQYSEKNTPQNIFLAGGLFANVKVNQRIAELPEVEKVFVFPNMGDGGLNAGAAFLGMNSLVKDYWKNFRCSHMFLGHGYSDAEILAALEKSGVSFRKSENIAFDVAHLIANDKVGARFNGRMEYGPRALCHRSILYSAADREVNGWLNQRLNRTEFMPFAPCVRDCDVAHYFNLPKGNIEPFRYMTMTCNVTEACEKEAPGVVHVDKTARPQILTEEDNPDAYAILTHYQKLTGRKILVNTSFNMHEEPIVQSPAEAISTFQRGHLDYLAIGSYIVS